MRSFEINISNLNKRITIEKLSGTTTTPNGFDTPNWIPFLTVWASVNNLFGKEFYADKAVQAENTVEFVTRYNKDLENLNTKEYRIVWNGKSYDITFIDNIQYANRWIKFKAVEVVKKWVIV